MLGQIWSDFLHAVQFLTRLPVHRWIQYDSTAILRSCRYFPLAGALIGLLSGAVYKMFQGHIPLSLAVLCAMIAQVAITGAMHEDALADAADGLCGYATRERALEIMRDSRIGSYGATALGLSLLVRFAALKELAAVGALVPVLTGACVVSRACGVMLMSTTENARSESATSRPFSGGVPRQLLPFFVLLSLLLGMVFLGQNLTPFIMAACITALLRWFFIKRIGGYTGDCAGAVINISELTVLVAALAHRG